MGADGIVFVDFLLVVVLLEVLGEILGVDHALQGRIHVTGVSQILKPYHPSFRGLLESE
jgi:hypothetical protein